MPSLVVVAREQGEGEAVWEKHEKEVTGRKRGGVFAGGLVLSGGKFHGTAPHLCGQIRKSLTLYVTVGCFMCNCRKDRTFLWSITFFVAMQATVRVPCTLWAKSTGQGSGVCKVTGGGQSPMSTSWLQLSVSAPKNAQLVSKCSCRVYSFTRSLFLFAVMLSRSMFYFFAFTSPDTHISF